MTAVSGAERLGGGRSPPPSRCHERGFASDLEWQPAGPGRADQAFAEGGPPSADSVRNGQARHGTSPTWLPRRGQFSSEPAGLQPRHRATGV